MDLWIHIVQTFFYQVLTLHTVQNILYLIFALLPNKTSHKKYIFPYNKLKNQLPE